MRKYLMGSLESDDGQGQLPAIEPDVPPPSSLPEDPAPVDRSPASVAPVDKSPINDDMRAKLMEHLATKSQNNAMGGLADALSNGNSFGNYFLGRMTPHNDAGKVFQNENAIEDQRMAIPGQVNAQLKDQYAVNKAGREDAAASVLPCKSSMIWA